MGQHWNEVVSDFRLAPHTEEQYHAFHAIFQRTTEMETQQSDAICQKLRQAGIIREDSDVPPA